MGAALAVAQRRREVGPRPSSELDGSAVDSYIPEPRAPHRQAVPDGHRGRVQRSRAVAPWPPAASSVARSSRSAKRSRFIGLQRDPQKSVGHRRRDVPQDLGLQGQAGDNVGLPASRRRQRTRSSAARCLRQARLASPRTRKFEGEVYVLKQGRGRPSHAVLHQLHGPSFTSVPPDVTGA